jgi:hypothetical protein
MALAELDINLTDEQKGMCGGRLLYSWTSSLTPRM